MIRLPPGYRPAGRGNNRGATKFLFERPGLPERNTEYGRLVFFTTGQQPPLIPHSVEGYEITRDLNQCVQCHDWPFNVDQGAPKISETHSVNREGVALDRVSSNCWFCTQCHVPQSNAKTLVNNDFKSALDVE